VEDFKRTPHRSLIEEAILAKGPNYSESSAHTFRSDSLAIFESLVAELGEEQVVAALARQGFKSVDVYLSTFRALAAIAKARRPKVQPEA
jgi:hypothetical protein